MSDRPPITFAIPFYSGADYLRRAIESLVAQTDPNWVGFVCDNAGPEPEAEMAARVREWGQGRVGYVRNPTNIGMAGNFNRCIDLAETELVTLLHSDDELEPDYCGTMHAATERHPEAVAIYCATVIIGPDSRPAFSMADAVKRFINPASRDEVVLHGEPGIRALVTANFIIAPTLCFRKRILGDRRFPDGFKFILDWELTTSLLLDGESLVGLPRRSYRYRRHDESTTEELSRTYQRFGEESAHYDRMREIALQHGWERCVELATQKRMLKLNMTYRTLKSLATLHFDDARRSLTLLRET